MSSSAFFPFGKDLREEIVSNPKGGYMFKKVVFFLCICCFLILFGCENEGEKSGLSDDEKARNEEKTRQEECEKKGSGWLWDMTKKECIVALKTEEDCTVKGEGWLWDAAKKECKAPPAPKLSNKEKCEAKGEGWYWHMIQPTDPGEEYKKCFKDLAGDCKDPAKPAVKKASPLECVAPHIIIISSRWRWLEIDPPGIGGYRNRADARRGVVMTGHNRCFVMDKKTADRYIPFAVNSYINDDDYGGGPKDKELVCGDGKVFKFRHRVRNVSCPTSKGVYEVYRDEVFGYDLRKVNKTVEELRHLGCFEHLISAKGLYN